MALIARLDLRDRRIAEEALAVQRSAYSVEAALIGTDAIPPLKETVADVQRLRLRAVGVVVDDRIVAFVGYKRRWRTVDINRLVVRPTHFRRGYARRLLEYVHDAEPGAKFKISTASANRPAVELYLALGYCRSGEVEKDGVRITRFKRPCSSPRRWRLRGTERGARRQS